jgi:hypothetical protein
MSAVSSIRFRPRSTPVNSPAGQKRLFLAEDGKLKTIDDSGNVEEVGGGGGGGSTETPFLCGNLSGNYTPDLVNGRYQYIYQLTGNLTIQEPLYNEATYRQLGEYLEFEIQWAPVARTLNFSSNIKRSGMSELTFPYTLVPYRSYFFKLRVLGGYWCLVSFVGEFEETVD